MKLNKLIIAIIFGSIFILGGFAESKAQIVTGSITLSSQADVDAFVGSSINGNLTISGGDITNLSPLSTLTSVSGNIDVYDNTALTNLDGLSGIISVGGFLNVVTNPVLTNINGLGNITSVGDFLQVSVNAVLTNINGLSGITSVGGILGVSANAALSSYCGLYALLSTPSPGGLSGQYFVTNNHVSNPSPTKQQIIDGGRCPFDGNVTLNTQAEVDAFGAHSYEEINGNITIFGGDITNLSPLSTLTSVSSLLVTSNAALTNLDGLSGITSVSGSLQILRNAVLTNLDGLSGITSIDVHLIVYDNAALKNLDSLSSITSVGGFLQVSANPVLTNLNGLSSITSVGGFLYVLNNTTLSSYCGLFNLLNTDGGLVGVYDVRDQNGVGIARATILEDGPCPILVNIKIYLEGPYSTSNNNMETSLGSNIPLSSPYTQDTVTVSSIPPIVVDWVLVELRDKTDPSILKASKSAFVLNNGDVVDIDGTSPVPFALPADDYHIFVTHRNHLAVMSNAAVPIN